MNIRIISDIHLEKSSDPNSLINHCFNIFSQFQDNDVLVIAGDVGNPYDKSYYEFLNSISSLFNIVFLVSGNHEYHNNNIDETDIHIENVTKHFLNVVFLQKKGYIYENVHFMGCTLWTEGICCKKVRTRDLHDIKNFDLNKIQSLNRDHIGWIKNNIKHNSVVITHHLPSYSLIHEKYKGSYDNPFYANHLDNILPSNGLWICGHSHMNTLCYVNNCLCAINPIGNEDEHSTYIHDLKIIY